MTAIDSVQRRHFIKGLAASGLILAASPTLFSCSSDSANRYVSAATNHAGEHFIVAFDELGNLQSQVQIANRGHDLVKIDEHRVVAFSRRPFTTMFVIDLSDNQLEKTIEAEKGYHFYGHGVFESKRGWLITTENHIDSSQGVIVVRDSQDFTIIKRYKSGGIGPHQCAMVPNTDLLVVANGGIQTHPDSGRKKLNLETMRPNLSYLSLETGEIKEQVVPPHFQLSLRHLAVAKSGEVIVAAQFQGHYRQQLPLVFSHKRGEQLVALPGSNAFWQMFDHYIASVAISDDVIAVTSPRGAQFAFWQLENHTFMLSKRFADCAGVATKNNQFVLSNGKGELLVKTRDKAFNMKKLSLKFDNHLVAI